MTHDEVEQLLGAYALDATNGEEREQVEAHVAGCARCRAEVAAHRETAAMLALGASGEPPAGLWDQVAASTFSARLAAGANLAPPSSPPLGTGPRQLSRRPAQWRGLRPARRFAWAAGTAAVATAAAFASFFGLEVGHLRSQVHQLQQQIGAAAIARAAANAASGPHATVTLATPGGAPSATVVVAPQGLAYWVSSGLAELPTSKTYQLWGLVRGKPVSLALLGPDPRVPGVFRVESGTTKLMVTTEPAGGVPLPTTAVLAAGTVPPAAMHI